MKIISFLLFFGFAKAATTDVVDLYTGIANTPPMVGDPEIAAKVCTDLTLDWKADGEGGVGTFEDPLYAVMSGGFGDGQNPACGQMYAIPIIGGTDYLYFEMAAFEKTSSISLEIGTLACAKVDAAACADTVAYILPELSNSFTYTAGAKPTVPDVTEINYCEGYDALEWTNPGTGADAANAKNAIVTGEDSSYCGMIYIYNGSYYQVKAHFVDPDGEAFGEEGTVVVDAGSCNDACGTPCQGTPAVCGAKSFPQFGGAPVVDETTTEATTAEATTAEATTATTEATTATTEATTTAGTTTAEDTTVEDASAFAVLAVSLLALIA